MRPRYAAILVVLAALLVLALVRTGEVQLVAAALIVALGAALFHAGPQRV